MISWWLLGVCFTVAGFFAWRDEYKKAEQLKARFESTISVSAGRQVNKSVITAYTDEITYFRARIDLIGIEPVGNIEAHITTIRKDGEQFPLVEEARLAIHGGSPGLAWLKEGVAGFIDIIRIAPKDNPVLALAWTYATVKPHMFETGHTYQMDVSITSDTTRTVRCTFEFNWTGDRDTAEFSLVSTQPS